jgi:hypothetical protein
LGFVGILGILGILGIENRKPKIENLKLKKSSLFPSRQQLPKKNFKKKKKRIFFLKIIFCVRADALESPRGRGFYHVRGR